MPQNKIISFNEKEVQKGSEFFKKKVADAASDGSTVESTKKSTKGSKRNSQNAKSLTKLQMGAVIKKYRMDSELGTQEFADMMGVSRGTVLHWETDVNRPSMEQIKDICETLSIPPAELFGLPMPASLDQNEENVIQFYRNSSEIGKRIIERNARSVCEEENAAEELKLKYSYELIPLQSTAAAAGTGCEFNDAKPEYRFVKKSDLSEEADTLIRVSGRSMEPRYRDGDFVYVRFTESADDGADVICTSADGAVIKHKIGNRLYSLNPDLPYGNKSEDDNVRIIGVVLGIVGRDDLASTEETYKLDNLQADKVRKFMRDSK